MSILGELDDGLPEIGDEPIRAWRTWNIESGDLVSLNKSHWPYRKAFVGTCRSLAGLDEKSRKLHGDVVPSAVCSCGIYAGKSLFHLGAAGHALQTKSADQVWGIVKLWGRTVCHSLGYRAQYAYPDLVVARDPLIAELIRRNYGCEVIVPDTPPPVVSVDAPAIQPAGNVIVSLVTAGRKTPMIAINLRPPNGQMWTYTGPADPTALGHWFGQFVPLLWRDCLAYGHGWNFMLDSRAWEQ